MKHEYQKKLNYLKSKYTTDQIREVWYLCDEIRALKHQYFYLDDDEIENKIGSYLDELYEECASYVISNHILTYKEFEEIYDILESMPIVPLLQ